MSYSRPARRALIATLVAASALWAHASWAGPQPPSLQPHQPKANVNCQTAGFRTLTAQPVSQNPLSYRASISTLFADAAADSDPNVLAFTQAYYEQIPGAAGYYYVLQRDFDNLDDRFFWAAVPIIDGQSDSTSPIEYEANPPPLSAVRFPKFAPEAGTSLFTFASDSPQFWPEQGGAPLGVWVGSHVNSDGVLSVYPFELSTPNADALAAAMSWASDDSTVYAQDATCVLIVDPANNVLDFAAHITEWDPKPSCPACTN